MVCSIQHICTLIRINAKVSMAMASSPSITLTVASSPSLEIEKRFEFGLQSLKKQHPQREEIMQLENTSPNNKRENREKAKVSKCKINKVRAIFKKQLQKEEVQYSKPCGKRRYTFSGHQENKILCKKRRRFTSIALPTKFLLGGNITDPLNLKSLEDEKVSQQLNAFTPQSSPAPTSKTRTQVQVLIPSNIYDPLNLNSGEEVEFNLFTSKSRKRRRHRKNKREENDVGVTSTKQSCHPQDGMKETNLSTEDNEKEAKVVHASTSGFEEKSVTDKIVSPVVPQGSPAKFYKRFHSRSFSKDADEKAIAQRKKQLKTKPSQSTGSKSKAEKYIHGNFICNRGNWNCGSYETEDQRLHLFDKRLFEGKDILDIGCNTGDIAIYIGKYFEPRKVVGIDIDRNLISIAQKKLVKIFSSNVSQDTHFPESMAKMYGPLARFCIPWTESAPETFPNNVTFIEANCVPSAEPFKIQAKFDVILCLRVTKWVHLNCGDEGLKLMFKQIFSQLRNEGHLILEPQPWFTYSSKKKITPGVYKNYCSIQMKPEKFCDYLLSEEIGFTSCELIGRTMNYGKGYHQPVYLLTKGLNVSCEQSEVNVNPLIPFFHHEWNCDSEAEICNSLHSGESDFTKDT